MSTARKRCADGYRNLLLVDDEFAFLAPMKKLLGTLGLHVDTAESFEQAMLLIRTAVYDAVIADVRLSGAYTTEGLDILEHIKSRNPESKVIIMTGFGSDHVRQESERLCADRYFEKPVPFSTLASALAELGLVAGPDSGPRPVQKVARHPGGTARTPTLSRN